MSSLTIILYCTTKYIDVIGCSCKLCKFKLLDIGIEMKIKIFNEIELDKIYRETKN